MMLKFLLSCLNSPQSLPSVALMGSVLIVDQPRKRGSGFITLLKLPCFVLGKALFNRTVWSVLYSEIVQYTCEQTSEHASWAWFEITRQCDSRQNFVAQSLIASSLHPYETGQYYHLITGFWSVPVCYWYSWFEFHCIFHLSFSIPFSHYLLEIQIHLRGRGDHSQILPGHPIGIPLESPLLDPA